MTEQDYINKAMRAAYEAILTSQKRQEALLFALKGIDSWRPDASQVQSSADPLWSYLIHQELEGWRKLFMFALTNDEWAEEAKKLAQERFLSEGTDIMGYLNPTLFEDFEEESMGNDPDRTLGQIVQRLSSTSREQSFSRSHLMRMWGKKALEVHENLREWITQTEPFLQHRGNET